MPPVGAVTLAKNTLVVTDGLLKQWSLVTDTEDASALVARSVIDCLLDLRSLASEFDELDLKARTAA